jgi:hypothetical protein
MMYSTNTFRYNRGDFRLVEKKKGKEKDEAGCSIHLNMQSTYSGDFFCFARGS